MLQVWDLYHLKAYWILYNLLTDIDALFFFFFLQLFNVSIVLICQFYFSTIYLFLW